MQISVIPTVRLAARTHGPDGGSCVSYSGPAASAAVGRLRAIRRHSADVRQADRRETRLQVQQPREPVDSPDEPSVVREEIQQGASARLTVRLNATMTLNSLTAYRRSNYRFFIDADATELTLQTADVPDLQRQVSQELTLVRRTPKLTWIGGAFSLRTRTKGRSRSPSISGSRFRSGPSRRSEATPGRSSARPRTACRGACL